MTDKILGIDIGNDSLKAVLVSHSLRAGFKVEMAEVIAFPAGEETAGSAAAAQALASLGNKIDFRQVRINYSLPAEAVSFHHVKLPFHEEKKIRQTIAFELETMLPQGMDDCLQDFNIISQVKGSTPHSEMLAAIVPRAVVQERLALLGPNPPEVNVAGIPALAVAFLLAARKPRTGSGLLLDVGARRTVAVFLRHDKVVQVRHFAFGGDLCREQKEDVVAEACRLFGQELANTLEFLHWGGSLDGALEWIVLTGGGSLAVGLKEDLARLFALPVTSVDVAESEGVQLSETIRAGWQPAIMNQALALAIHRPEVGRGFNFPLQKSPVMMGGSEFGRMWKRGAAVLAVAALLLGLDSYLDYRYSRTRLDDLKKEIGAVFKTAAPEITRIVDPVQQFKVKIAEAKKISAGLGGMEGNATVLDLIKELSVLAPPATELLVTGFNLDEDRLAIKGTVKNFDAVEQLKRELARSTYFTNLQVGSTNLAKKGDKVEFDLRMTAKR